jgi:hypothetical protein
MSGSRQARNASSICNRTNVCGGPKKAGIAPLVGFYLTSNPTLMGAPQSVPLFCIPNRTVQTQTYGYRATITGHMG